MEALYILNSMTVYYALFILPFGTAGNILLIYTILKSKTLKSNNIFAFSIYAYVIGTIGMYIWCLDSYFIKFYEKTIGDHSAEFCKTFLYFQMCTQQLSYYTWVVAFVKSIIYV